MNEHFIKISTKVRERIIIAGLIEQEITNALYPFGSIYISASKVQESSHMSIIKAMSSGLIPICNDHSWNS